MFFKIFLALTLFLFLPLPVLSPSAHAEPAPAPAPKVIDLGPLKAEKYIYVNLDDMEMRLYEHGSYRSLPVLSIRRMGSKYDTPTGLFDIKTKEMNHFSSIGHVWMGQSMQFDGNYFIHGWPYYPDGTPVPKGFSGGCIRMSDADVAVVYEFAEIGTPVLVEAKPLVIHTQQ